MENRSLRQPAAVGLAALLALAVGAGGSLAQEPAIEAPEPGVPELFTLEGQFVRAAYNNEGYVTLGYRMAMGPSAYRAAVYIKSRRSCSSSGAAQTMPWTHRM